MVKLLEDRVLIQKDEQSEQTVGGIVLASSAGQNTATGTVVSVGAGWTTETGAFVEGQLQEGDKVLFLSADGQEVDVEGQTYTLLRERQVIGTLN